MGLVNSFRILFLIIALFAVIYTMGHLDSSKTSQFLTALGIDSPSHSGGQQGMHSRVVTQVETSKIVICPTRIRAFVWPDGRKLEESASGMKTRWLAYDPAPREVNSIEVEKWLSLHCQVSAVIYNPTLDTSRGAQRGGSADAFAKSLGFELVGGKTIQLRKGGPDLYALEKQIFRSKDLSDALSELAQIAKFDKPEKGS